MRRSCEGVGRVLVPISGRVLILLGGDRGGLPILASATIGVGF